MLIQISELSGTALDWAVAKCEGREIGPLSGKQITVLSCGIPRIAAFAPSTDWSQGGPIIEREGITVCNLSDSRWVAGYGIATYKRHNQAGATLLAACMRCYVASKLGAEVEVPGELVQ